MKKALILAASALSIAVGAAYPDDPKLAYGDDAFADGGSAYEEVAAPRSYRPCRPGPGDDNCIQLYERGVRAAYAEWLSDGSEYGRPGAPEAAVGGPIERRTGYPPCRSRSDDRCIQLYERGADPEANTPGL